MTSALWITVISPAPWALRSMVSMRSRMSNRAESPGRNITPASDSRRSMSWIAAIRACPPEATASLPVFSISSVRMNTLVFVLAMIEAASLALLRSIAGRSWLA